MLCLLLPIGGPPAVILGTQFPWCMLQDHGCMLEPWKASVRWHTSITSKFCRKSDTDILKERKVDLSKGCWPACSKKSSHCPHNVDDLFQWCVFRWPYKLTRTLHPPDWLFPVGSVPQYSRRSTLDWRTDTIILKLLKPYKRWLQDNVIWMSNLQCQSSKLICFPTLSSHSRVLPTLCCPRGSGAAPNIQFHVWFEPVGQKRTSRKAFRKKTDVNNKLGLYLLHCCQRVSVSEHDPQFILLFQRSLEKTKSTHVQERAQIHESPHRRWFSAGTCPVWSLSLSFRG